MIDCTDERARAIRDRKRRCASGPALQAALRTPLQQLLETAGSPDGIWLAQPVAVVMSFMATSRWDDHTSTRPTERRADGAARLLGRPTPLVGRVQELATLAAIVEQA